MPLICKAAQKNQASPSEPRSAACLSFCHASEPWEPRGDAAAKGNHPNQRSLKSPFTNLFGFGLVVHTPHSFLMGVATQEIKL